MPTMFRELKLSIAVAEFCAPEAFAPLSELALIEPLLGYFQKSLWDKPKSVQTSASVLNLEFSIPNLTSLFL